MGLMAEDGCKGLRIQDKTAIEATMQRCGDAEMRRGQCWRNRRVELSIREFMGGERWSFGPSELCNGSFTRLLSELVIDS